MDRLLVIGGSGFIGQEICRLALAADYDVRSVSRGGRPDGTADWTDRVSWTEANVFSPNQWRNQLVNCDAVIHSIGTLHESPADGRSFERLNGDSTILTALEAERAGVASFVFISASAAPPTVRQEYVSSKRRAERAISDLDLQMTTLRAGPIYGEGQPHFSGIVNAGFRLLDQIKPISKRLGVARPLPLYPVARAALAAADPDRELPSVLDIEAIAAYRI